MHILALYKFWVQEYFKTNTLKMNMIPHSPMESENEERRAIAIFSPVAHHHSGFTKLVVKEKIMNY